MRSPTILFSLFVITSLNVKAESPNLRLDQVYENLQMAFDQSSLSESREKELKDFLELTKKRNVNVARNQTCPSGAESEALICKVLYRKKEVVRPERPPGQPSVGQVRRHLQKKEYAALANVTTGRFYLTFKPMKTAVVRKFADALLKEENPCVAPTSLFTMLGGKMEENFSEEAGIELVTKLYQQGLTCSVDKNSLLGQYRLGMFEMLKDSCEAGIPHLRAVLKEPALDYLHTRSLYWIARCKSRDKDSKDKEVVRELETMAENFPLSYHSLLAFEGRPDEMFQKIKARSEPQLLLRTQIGDAVFNTAIEAVEYFLRNRELGLARNILAYFDIDEFLPLEPAFRLYVALLTNHLQDGLGTFRLMASLMIDDRNMQSLTAMKLFFPTWYVDLIGKHTAKGDLDPYLVISLIRQESAFNPRARSGAGARGLMQLMPSTARSLDRRATKDRLYDPELSIRLGTTYLRRMIGRHQGDLHLMLGSYNAGASQVADWQKRYLTTDRLLFTDLMPFRETREYAAIILRNHFWYTRLYPNLFSSTEVEKE